MFGETSNNANNEELVKCLSWADKNLESHEEFIELLL